jgi:hypothetical protein
VPFIRYTRDKRGYDSTMVMHVYRPGSGPQRTRVLYLFRSPPNVRVGRKPLEPEVVEALEHTHPDLTFDWTALLREPPPPPPPRHDPRDRPGRPSRPGRPRGEPVPAVAAVLEDQSLLGRVLGAEHAARLRGRYQELLQRIARRATTPEQREQLTDRAGRLNPDEWAEEAAVRAGARTVDEEWAAIAAELPQRRRGRRGGRHRPSGRAGTTGPEFSEIMAGNGERRGEQSEARLADSDRLDADRGGRDSVSADPVGPPETRTATDVPGDH